MLSAVAAALGKDAPVAFRVNPDVEAGTHAKISTGAAHNKFGIAAADALAAYAPRARLPGLELSGVAVHIGSQLTSLAPLEAAFGARRADRALRADGPRYQHRRSRRRARRRLRPGRPPPPTPADYGAMVAAGDARTGASRLIFEPGRLIVAQCRRTAERA